MSWRPASVRGRLTVWHAAVLTAIVCVFSAGIFVFVRAKLRPEGEQSKREALHHIPADRCYTDSSKSGCSLEAICSARALPCHQSTRQSVMTGGSVQKFRARRVPSIFQFHVGGVGARRDA